MRPSSTRTTRSNNAKSCLHAPQGRASDPKFSGAGCFVVMQPSWGSCGRTNQSNTERAIRYFSARSDKGFTVFLLHRPVLPDGKDSRCHVPCQCHQVLERPRGKDFR